MLTYVELQLKIVSTILRWYPVVLRWLAHEELINWLF